MTVNLFLENEKNYAYQKHCAKHSYKLIYTF